MIRDKYIANRLFESDYRRGSYTDLVGGTSPTVLGAPTWRQDGGRNLSFDGIDDVLQFTNLFNLGTTDFTIEFVVEFDVLDANEYVIGKYEDVNNRWYIRKSTDNTLSLYAVDSSEIRLNIKNSTAIEANKWYHVIISGPRGGNTKVYVNGIDDTYVPTSACSASDVSNTGNFQVGAVSTSEGRCCLKYVGIYNVAFTPEDAAKSYEDYQRFVPYSVADFKSKDRYINAIADGDAKKTGADDWIVDGVGGVLSKVVDAERGQVLAVYSGAGNITYAYQYNLEVGYYRLRGWLKGDAANGGIARIKVGGVWMTGSNATDTWQYIDEVVYNPSSSSTPFKMGQTATTTSYAYYSDIECIKLNSNNENDFASPQGYIADCKGWNESVTDVTSGFLENTGWQRSTGTWQIDNVDGFNKEINCISAGLLYMPMNQIYGTWEFDLYHSAANADYVTFFADRVGASNTPIGYQFIVGPTEIVTLRKITGGGSANIVQTGTGQFPEGSYTNVKVTRTTLGNWKVYIDDVYVNDGDDNTYTSGCIYAVLDIGTGSKIRNFKFIPYIQ